MAVYTALSSAQINALLRRYQIGTLHDYQPVLDGIENTNYFVTIRQDSSGGLKDYLLTLFEHITSAELAFYLNWLQQLSSAKLPVAPAVTDSNGQSIAELANRPAALFEKLPGSHPQDITAAQCEAIGRALGHLHTASEQDHKHHQGPRNLDWLRDLGHSIAGSISAAEQQLLTTGLAACTQLTDNKTLPRGLIHGDLFPDNTLFIDDQLTGLVDFFSGGDGLFAFDLAVAVNAWCSDSSGELVTERYQAMLASYQQVRPLCAAERELWGDFLVLAATRFWVSRRASQLASKTHSDDDAYRKTKDPEHYRRILQQRVEQRPRIE